MPKPQKPKDPPNVLDFPEFGDDYIKKEDMPADSEQFEVPPLDIDYIIGKDWMSLFTNVLWAIAIYLVVYAVGVKKFHMSHEWALAIGLCVVWVLIVMVADRLYTTVESREGKFYLDELTGEMMVYGLGFHFTTWHSKWEDEEINFQKHVLVVASRETKNEIIFSTEDGKIEMFLEFKLLFQRVEDELALGHTLNYELGEIKEMIVARIARRASDAGGMNSYESLLYFKSEFIRHICSIFAGDKKRSPWEKELGINVIGVNVTRVDLTPESRKIVDARTVGDMVSEITKEHVAELDVDPNVAYQGALAITGAVPQTRTISTTEIKVEGLPKNATFVSLGGNAGVAANVTK